MRAPVWMDKSLRLKIGAVVLATTFIALALSYAMSAWQQSGWERRELVSHQAAVAQMLASNLSASLVFNDPTSATVLLKSVHRIPNVEYAYVLNQKGEVFAASRAGLTLPHAVAPGRTRAAQRVTGGMLEVRAPIDLDAEQVGQLVLVSNFEALHDALVGQAVVAGMLFLAAMVVAMGAGFWLVDLLIVPVRRLSAAIAAARRNSDFSQRLPRGGADELGRLTDDFNALFRQLGQNDHALKQGFEELTLARDQAEAANTAKSQFLANMSHEIRTPLNGVLGMVQVMELGDLPEAQRDHLHTIRDSGQTLLQVLNDVLDFSKIEAGMMQLSAAEFSMEDLCRAVTATFAGRAAQKGVELDYAVAEDAKGAWMGDAVRIRQVLMNLVSNAVKFTDLGRVSMAVTCEPGGLAIVVADTGIGMAEADIPRLFNKFSQVDESSTRRFGGTGLGLAISRELVDLMGGAIKVHSVPGTGSSFVVWLPLLRLDAAAPKLRATAAPPPAFVDPLERPVRILAAEDNPTNQRVLAALLGTLDVDLTIVDNGALAVEAWHTTGFDLILMDIQMPVMGGVEACRLIRAEEAARGAGPIPIIALSANAMSHQVDEYLRAGMNAHIAKPIDFAALCAAIEAAVRPAPEIVPPLLPLYLAS